MSDKSQEKLIRTLIRYTGVEWSKCFSFQEAMLEMALLEP